LCQIARGFLWIWANPRIFPVPKTLDHWISKAVLRERVWLNRDAIPISVHPRTNPDILYAVSDIWMVFFLWGVLEFDLWPTLFGTVIVYLGKVWFLDRMVWLWEDMKDATPE
jgi:hypothetical protein